MLVSDLKPVNLNAARDVLERARSSPGDYTTPLQRRLPAKRCDSRHEAAVALRVNEWLAEHGQSRVADAWSTREDWPWLRCAHFTSEAFQQAGMLCHLRANVSAGGRSGCSKSRRGWDAVLPGPDFNALESCRSMRAMFWNGPEPTKCADPLDLPPWCPDKSGVGPSRLGETSTMGGNALQSAWSCGRMSFPKATVCPQSRRPVTSTMHCKHCA